RLGPEAPGHSAPARGPGRPTAPGGSPPKSSHLWQEDGHLDTQTPGRGLLGNRARHREGEPRNRAADAVAGGRDMAAGGVVDAKPGPAVRGKEGPPGPVPAALGPAPGLGGRVRR